MEDGNDGINHLLSLPLKAIIILAQSTPGQNLVLIGNPNPVSFH